MVKHTDTVKAKVWSHKGEANKKVRALFRSGKWNPENYQPKDLWLSDKQFQEYTLARFRDNIRKTAKQVILEGGKYSDCSGSESEDLQSEVESGDSEGTYEYQSDITPVFQTFSSDSEEDSDYDSSIGSFITTSEELLLSPVKMPPSATPKKKSTVKVAKAKTPIRQARQVSQPSTGELPLLTSNVALRATGTMILPMNGALWKHSASQQKHISMAILAPSGADPEDLVGNVCRGGNKFMLSFLWGEELLDVTHFNNQAWGGQYGLDSVKGAAFTDAGIDAETPGMDYGGYAFEGRRARSVMMIDLPFKCEEVYCDSLGFRGYRMKDIENHDGKIRTYVFVELVGVRTITTQTKPRLVKEGVTRRVARPTSGQKYSAPRYAKTPDSAGKKQKRDTYETPIEEMSTTPLGFSPESVTPGTTRQPEFGSALSRDSRRVPSGESVATAQVGVSNIAAMEMADYFRMKHGENWMNLPEFNVRRR